MKLDWSSKGRARTYTGTLVGTVLCIAFSFLYDSYSFTTGEWHWGTDPLNNFIIPVLLAPPLLFFLLDKMRQLAIAHHELMNVAATDALTNVLNRRAFTEMVGEYLKRVEDSSAPSHGALLVVDVDHFKAVNDNFGHEHGDHALQIIAKTIAESLRDTDLVGRLGGEEFGIFLPLHTPERTSVVAERIRLAVNEADFFADGRRHGLSVSVGGVTFDAPASFVDLYRSADERLYKAKHNGRNRVELSAFGRHSAMLATVH